jgi:hypothetical protein
MTRDRELWACANLLIEQYGNNAATKAAERADALLKGGAQEGAATWRLIGQRINQLQAPHSGAAH